ncbi:MAG: DUF5652 family protein [Candidatus Pacearchaeota archaeon]
MGTYFDFISSQIGIPIWFLVIIILWELVWKILATWKAAKNNSIVWFVILMVFNTIGILSILYFYIFSKMKRSSKKRTKK